MTESKVKLSFACAEGNADYLHTAKAKPKKTKKKKKKLNCTNFKDANRAVCRTHLEISVVHSTTMAIVNSIYKLLKIFPCLILFEPSLVNLANHHKNICCWSANDDPHIKSHDIRKYYIPPTQTARMDCCLFPYQKEGIVKGGSWLTILPKSSPPFAYSITM
jgi:hypothetical protein